VLYGIALFYEGLELLYAGQEQIIETYRKQFRNVIRHGTDMLDKAEELLRQVRGGSIPDTDLEAFDLSLAEGYPKPPDLLKRADILVAAYNELFPGRDRATPFTEDETLSLMESASSRL